MARLPMTPNVMLWREMSYCAKSVRPYYGIIYYTFVRIVARIIKNGAIVTGDPWACSSGQPHKNGIIMADVIASDAKADALVATIASPDQKEWRLNG